MGSPFKDSLKALEADIQLANTLALSSPRELDGACLQMRLSYSPAANIFMCLVQLFDCQLAGALGLLRILVYLTYADGKSTMLIHERKASIRQFYGVIFPSLLQLQGGITDFEDEKQKKICSLRYSGKDDLQRGKFSEIDAERERECAICMEFNSKVVLPNCNHSLCLKCYRDWECAICMEFNSKVVLPNCNHSLCLKCYRDWRSRSQSCPFCRNSLRRVNSADLWICPDSTEIVDLSIVWKENLHRLFMYIDKLPLVFPDHIFSHYDSRVSCNVVQSLDLPIRTSLMEEDGKGKIKNKSAVSYCICEELQRPKQYAPVIQL